MNSEIVLEDINKLVEHFKCEIPATVISFLSSFKGSMEFLNNENFELKYKLDDGYETDDIIEAVFTTKEIIEQLPYIGYLEELKTHFELSDDYVQTEFLFPIVGLMDGIVYIAINGKNKDALYLADNGDFGITKLDISLSDLVQKLKGN